LVRLSDLKTPEMSTMARLTVYPARDEWCVSYEAVFLVSFQSREMAEQAAINLARAAVMKGEMISIETKSEAALVDGPALVAVSPLQPPQYLPR
jgi:hypothetical protein